MDAQQLRELSRKTEKVRRLLRDSGRAAALLDRQESFAWLSTGGDSRVVRTQEGGVGTLVITAKKTFLVAYPMDGPRLMDEELGGSDIELVTVRWHEGTRQARALALCGGGAVLSDRPIPGTTFDPTSLTRLHYPLSEVEISTCRELGRRTEQILRRVADGLTPELTEIEVAARLASEYERQGMIIDVLLVAGEERISRYRHPLPSQKPIGKLVLLHPAVRFRGLHANVTRMVSLGGSVPAEVARRYEAVSQLQALTLSMCTPGTPFRAIFEARKRLYERLGFADEWELHFPGGPTGYVLEEDISADLDATVSDGQPFDWFVTVTGAKVEELGLTNGGRRELLSATGAWPTVPFTSGDLTVPTPAILVR